MQLSKLCLATKKFLSAMVITTTVLSTTPIQKINLKGSEINVSAATETKISNPRIVKDSSLKSGQKVTWDCIYFGSYPQTEIVDTPHRSGAFAKKWEEEDDYEIEPSVYSKLKNATGWDSNGDITIDNVKYRRLSSDDTTYKFLSDQEGYYNWDKDNDTKYHYFRYEKIKWRVLNVDGNEALLLSDKILDTQKYDTWHKTTWEKSIIRSWLNGYKGLQNSKDDDYTKNNFINSAFSEEEENAIEETKIKNNNNLTYQTEGGNDTQDQIFLLSQSEVSVDAAKYGFLTEAVSTDDARSCKSSTYAKAMGNAVNIFTDNYGCSWWWLRSPGLNSRYASAIDYFGYTGGLPVDNVNAGIRPALKLDLSHTNVWNYADTVSNAKEKENSSVKQPEYKDTADTNLPYIGPSVKLFDELSGEAYDPITKIYPGEYKISIPAIGTKVTRSNDKDGGYTIKALIGVNKKTYNEDEIVKKIKKAENNLNQVKGMRSVLMADGDKESFDLTKKFEKKPEINLIGYYETKYDENGKLISKNGRIGFLLRWEASKTVQYISATPPIPYYIGVKGTIDGTNVLKINSIDKSGIEFELTGLSTKGFFNANCGLGISGLATIGASGEATLNWQIVPWSKGDMTGNVYLESQIIFLYDYRRSVITGNNVRLWNTTKKDTDKKDENKSAKLKSVSNSQIKLKLKDRTYQNKTSAWKGNISAKNNKLRQASSNNTITTKELQSYILPNSIPKMIKQEDDTIMVFQSNDASRSTQNSVKLMYSIYHNGKWSEPKAFLDNGTLDTFADLKKIGNDIFVTWQKCDKKIADSADIDKQTENIAKDSEIYISKYDANTKSFGKVEKISDNDTLDMMPKLIDKNGTPAVMWVNVPSNDIVTLKGKKTIKVSEYDNNKWQQATDIGNTDTYISELTGTYAENKYHAIYIGTDNDQNTKFYDLDTGKENVVYDNAADLSNIHVTKDIITYVQDGTLKSYNLSTKITKDISDSNKTAISANAIQESNGDKTAILWMENDDSGCKFYSSVKTKDGVQYTATVTNNGQVAASGIIDFYKDNKLSDKLTTKAVSTIQAGESKKVTFNYKTSDMKFDEDQNTYCSMKLSSDDEKDSNSQNDSYYGVIYRWELPGQNDISDCTVKLSSEQFTEDGLAKEPDITVKRGNLLLEKGTDYQVEYHNNVKAGMAVVAITGINRYVGRIERSYVINVAQKDHNQNNNSTENKSDKSNLIKPIVKVDKITINGISKQIAAGKSIKLTANILPKNAKNKAVNWETSNKKIATVNKNGVVKINKRAAGKTVTITAIAKDGSNKKATYKIKVMKGSVKSISIKGKKTVKAGKTLKLTAKVKASKGANKKLIWKSSNTKYATVSSSGKVIAKKTGKKKTVIITVMSTDGTNKKKTVKIKIK